MEDGEQAARSIASAHAEILLLHDRLAQEQRAREALEMLVARARSAARVNAEADWIDRFEVAMRERQQQAERLREELRTANDARIRLKAKIEADQRSGAETPTQQALSAENDTLRGSLRAAEQANADLRTQAELAARLADMLYGEHAR